MNERDLEELLFDVLHELMSASEDEDDPLHDLGERTGDIKRLWTYEEAGMLTDDRGIVVTCVDRSEFQITIVKSR